MIMIFLYFESREEIVSYFYGLVQ